ncbi:CUB domain-containing protein 2-like [Branchiostoma lanceolatum]|uniref:CUB domain-containing protein 2-like n=1 Tax=Branchiostoma lanceolatum TaxID=7740 RepID=UPI0034512A0F
MLVRFTSDHSGTAQGFKFSYTAYTVPWPSIPICGRSLTAPPKGYVTSPNYPKNYGNNENCGWTITVPEGSTVSLTVKWVNIEEGFDFLNIYDGDSSSRIWLRRYTGEVSTNSITSISNYMFVKFTSDGGTTAQGFLLSYTATPISTTRCGGSLTAPPKGYVTSPNYPIAYGNNENCEWTITVPEGSTVRLTFHSFQLENADSLTIYDKDATPTSGNRCGGNLTAPPGGIVTSPNYPNDYGNEENCDWTITVPEGNIVRLTFDSFVTEVDFDFLFVYDGDSDTAAPLQR